MRRLAAFVAIIALLGLVLVLTWQVQLHRSHRAHDDDPAVVEVGASAPVGMST